MSRKPAPDDGRAGTARLAGASEPKRDNKPHNTLKVYADSNADRDAALAHELLRPSVRAACTTQQYSKGYFGDEMDLTALVDELSKQNTAVHGGDMRRAEAMLVSQAHTLDAIFNELARRAALNMGEYLQATETYMRLALKAQSQCRATLEALATIKNPPHLAFVKQANIGQAVQVNNGTATADANRAFQDQYARARETETEPTKLLEHSNGQRLDLGAPSATGEADSSLETVGEIDGATHGIR